MCQLAVVTFFYRNIICNASRKKIQLTVIWKFSDAIWSERKNDFWVGHLSKNYDHFYLSHFYVSVLVVLCRCISQMFWEMSYMLNVVYGVFFKKWRDNTKVSPLFYSYIFLQLKRPLTMAWCKIHRIIFTWHTNICPYLLIRPLRFILTILSESLKIF